jgi:hypothetical protein
MPTVSATTSPSNLAKQLSDSNGLGTVLGKGPTDSIGFWQDPAANVVGGVVQPSGNAQAALLRGAPSGVVTGWSSFQTALASAGVATITSGESGLTIQQGTTTSARVLLGTADMVYINKPTSQAGLGVGNVRVSAANIVGVTLNNPTAATLTPTTNQTYRIASTRGLPTIAAVLSPAAVQPNSVTEQIFTLTAAQIGTGPGFSAGQLLQVMKPTAQAGLDIVGMRVAGNNQYGITFANVTAATITPTAAESYTLQALSALDAHNNFMLFTMNVGAIGATSGTGYAVTGGNTVFTGALATDLPIGPPQAPTAANAGLAATNASAPVMNVITADTMTIWFQSVGTGSTPTANTYWDQLVFRLNPAAPLVLYSQTLTPVSVAANTTAEQGFTVTGLLANTVVWVNKPSATSGLGIAGVRISAASTLQINYINTTSAAIVPPAETYVIGNFQAQAPTPTTSNTTGGAVSQQCVQAIMSGINQLAKVRTDLVATGFWAGT